MPRLIAIAAAAFVLGLAAHASRAAEMAMPGASIGASNSGETDAVREEVAATAAPHAGASAAPSTESTHRHVHPDSVSETREASARNAVGTDAGGSADLAPKSRHRGGAWQALLPGVMK